MSESANCVRSGIAGLDDVLGGGFPRGQFTLIRGTSGAGKTTLGMQFLMEGARRGEAALYLGTSETEQEIGRIARSHGWSLEGVSLHHHKHPSVAVEQTMLHPAEVELPQTMESLLSVVNAVSPSRLVIDSLAEFRLLARDELWYRRQLMTLKQHFADGRCTVLLVEVPNREQAAVDTLVSGVIVLEHTAPQYGADRRRLRAVKIRGQRFATGHHDYCIRTGGLEVFPRLTAAEHRHRFPFEQLSTGLPELDAMLHGGMTRGTSVLLLGATGTGKSLMATQLAIASAQRGERAVLFAFDERVQTMYQRAESVGLPLQRHVDDGTIEIRQVDPAELSSGEFSHSARLLAANEEIRMLVIDSLNGYAYAMPEEHLLSVHLHELISYLNQQGVTSVFTMTQHGVLAQQRGQPFDVSYIADTVLLLRHFEFEGQLHKAVSVYKHRSGSHDTTMHALQAGPAGLRLSKPLRNFRGILAGLAVFTGKTLDDHDGDDDAVGE